MSVFYFFKSPTPSDDDKYSAVLRKNRDVLYLFQKADVSGVALITPTLQWGPDFGEPTNDTTFVCSGVVTMPELALENIKTCECALSGIDFDIEYNPLACSGVVMMPELALENSKTCQGEITELQFLISGVMAYKDSFTPTATTLGTCNDDTNKNQQDLRAANIIAVENTPIIFIGFQLSGLSANATVTSATLHLKPVTAPAGVSHNYHIREISSAQESWLETTVTCSNNPDIGVDRQTYSQPANTNELSITLNSGVMSYIQGRMGSATTCTFAIQDQEAVGVLTVYESKDEGTNNNLGPRLSLTWTVPV